MVQRCSYPGCHALTKTARCVQHQRRTRSPTTQQRDRINAARRDRIRRAVLERDNHTCQLCGARATVVDHIVPAARGGEFTPANLRALCAPCNARKGAR